MSLAASVRPLLIADSSCDLPAALLERFGVAGIPFPVIIGGEEELDDFGVTLTAGSFYGRMRDGAVPTTTQIPLASYLEAFRAAAATGRPIVHLTLSSGLSGTYEIALMARDLVMQEIPDADITVVDSLSASTALALLVYEAARLVEAGVGRDELVAWALEARSRIGAYFTLESLETLRRGGRISDVAAVAGAMLDVRPILRIDETGHLVLKDRVRGRKKSMRALVDLIGERGDDPASRTIAIGHGDALDDAEALRDMVLERTGAGEVLVTTTGPVIGSHTGPGMLSLVFWERA